MQATEQIQCSLKAIQVPKKGGGDSNLSSINYTENT